MEEKIIITVVDPHTRSKSKINAYTEEHAMKIIKSCLEDGKRIKIDSPIIKMIMSKLIGEKRKDDLDYER